MVFDNCYHVLCFCNKNMVINKIKVTTKFTELIELMKHLKDKNFLVLISCFS